MDAEKEINDFVVLSTHKAETVFFSILYCGSSICHVLWISLFQHVIDERVYLSRRFSHAWLIKKMEKANERS